jgi:O-antigen ligase
MMDRVDARAALAALRPERRRRVLGFATCLLLGAVVLLVVTTAEQGLAMVAMVLGALFLVARPHWGILAIFVLVIFRINPVAIGPLGTSELLAAPLLLPLVHEFLRDRGVWVWHVSQVRLLLGIGGVLLAATAWSVLMHPAPPLTEQERAGSVLFLFGQQFLFLIYLLYFIKKPRHLVYAALALLLLVLAAALDSLDLLDAGHGVYRARVSQGWAANSNRLAFLCVWGTALAWSLRFKAPRRWWRPLTLAPLLGLPIVTLMTGSRNGLLQLTLLGGLVLLEQRQWAPAQRGRAVALMALVAVVVLLLAPSDMLERASNFDPAGRSVEGRTATLWAGARMVAEHPLLGVGPGNFRWRNAELIGLPLSSHNSYLWALTAGGPLLLFLYLAIFYRTYRMLRSVERRGPHELTWLATALRFNVVILIAFSFFADLWLTHPFYLVLGLTIVLFRMAASSGSPMVTASAPPRLVIA